MRRSTIAAIATGALVFGIVIGSMTISLAQAANGDDTTATGEATAKGGPGGGLLGIVSELSGLDVTTIFEGLRDGKSLAAVADGNGVESSEIIERVISEHKAILDQRLADGLITSEQYDWMLERMDERAEAMILGDGPGMIGSGRGRGFGMMGSRGAPGSGMMQGFDVPGGGPGACQDWAPDQGGGEDSPSA